jgi:hypothetical protein
MIEILAMRPVANENWLLFSRASKRKPVRNRNWFFAELPV